MLKQMRTGAQSVLIKTVLFGILMMAMAGLALMDVQGMFRNGVGANTVASIDGQKIGTAEFDRMVRMAMRTRQMNQADAYQAGLPQQVLREDLDARMIARAAQDLGLVVDDSLAAKQVKEMIRPLTAKNISEQEALARLLQAYGMSEGELVWTLKAQIASQQLYAAMTSGTYVPQKTVEDILKYKNEWRRGEYFTLTPDDVKKAAPPSQEDLKTYYESVSGDYALPEYRELSVLILDKKQLEDTARPSEEKLLQYYEDNIGDYKTPEKRTISQIVAHNKEDADKIYDTLKGSGSISKAQAAVDKNKSEYIKAASFTADALPDEFSKPVFAAEEKQAIPPIQTPLGWHVLYVEKISSSITRSFADVKASIRHELTQEMASEALYNTANKIDDDVAGGKALAEVAKEYGFSILKTGRIDENGFSANSRKKPDTSIPLYDKVVSTGFGLQKGESSPLIETPTGSFLIVAADDVIPTEKRAFEKVRDEIAARWEARRRLEFLSVRASEITDRLKKGESFAAIAKSYNKPVQSIGPVKRGSGSKAPNDLTTALFSIPQQGGSVSVSGDNTVTVVRLTERQTRPSTDQKEQKAMADLISKTIQKDILDQYHSALTKKYSVKVNDRLIANMYAPKDEAY